MLLFTEKIKWASISLVITFGLVLFKDVWSHLYSKSSSIISFFFLLTIFLFVASFIRAWFDYVNYTFTFEEFGIKMKRGIMMKKENTIPYRQIQNVNIVRSPWHQLLGLSKLVMTTAGHEEEGEKGLSEVSIEAVDKELAEEMRQNLESKIGVQVVRNESTTPLQNT